MRDPVLSLAGALLALVGAVVVVAVPDADAAGLLLCVLGGACCAAGRDDFSTAEVEP